MPELVELEQRSLSFPDKAKGIIIQTADDYKEAGSFLVAVKSLRKEIQDTFSPLKEKAFSAHKAIVAEEKRHEEPLIEAEKIVRGVMIQWDKSQEELRRKKEDEIRKAALAIETENKIQEALAAEAAGQIEEAQAIMEEEIYVPPIIVQKQVPKVQGVQFRTTWKWRVKDIKKVPLEYFVLDETKIGAVVRGMKRAGEVIPGIEAYPGKS